MITYEKINDLYAEIFYNDEKIGHIEKHRDFFTLEISYHRLDLSHSKRKLIGTLAKKIYLRLEAKKRRRLFFDRKIKKSILQTNYKIKE